MSFLQEVKSLKPSPKDLRKFGLMVGGIFLLLGCWYLYRHKSYAMYFVVPGVVLFLGGLVVPRALRLVYLVWMTLGLALGMVVSTVILTVFFYLVVTPIGLAARIAGKDFLSLKLDSSASSYWVLRERRSVPAKDYEKQF